MLRNDFNQAWKRNPSKETARAKDGGLDQSVYQGTHGNCKRLVKENGGNGPSFWPWVSHWEGEALMG